MTSIAPSLGRERGQAVQVAAAAADGGQRAGQQAVGIAAGHADPRRSEVDGEPDAGPQRPAPCSGLISTEGLVGATGWLQHGLTLRHPVPPCLSQPHEPPQMPRQSRRWRGRPAARRRPGRRRRGRRRPRPAPAAACGPAPRRPGPAPRARLVDRDHDRGPVRRDAGHRSPRRAAPAGSRPRTSSASLRMPSAVVPSGHPVRDERRPRRCPRRRRPVRRPRRAAARSAAGPGPARRRGPG